MSKLTIFTGEKQAIPLVLKEQLPALFQKEIQEASRLPASRIETYQKSLQLPPLKKKKQVWSVAHLEEKVIGYGNLTWNAKGSNLNRAFFFVYLEPAERQKGYGTLMSKELLQFVPSQVTILESFCFQHTPGSNYLKNKFKGKEVYNSSVSLSKIREFDPEEVAKKAQIMKEEANKNGYE
ncbi:MAG: GNAT family N-acetyltransferase, partial [Candidatus Kariarchaeaceae archaeon]